VYRKLIVLISFVAVLGVLGIVRIHYLNQKPSNPSEFSWINKAEIYSLGIVMSVIAYPLYPEIAREHLMLYSPFEGETKKINDDFFLKSTRVQKAIKQAKNSGKEVRLWWPASDYELKLDMDQYWESRVALAFNGGWLRIEGDQAIARIPIRYPKRAFAPLFTVPGIGTFGVQEGLFWVLQQEGWYHTGEVEWVAAINGSM